MQHDNDINDTARYQLDRFLNSPESFEYDLNSCDIAILYAISYFIDCDKDGKNACCAKRITIANRARVNRDTANIHIHKLAEQGLIILRRRWKLVWITIGEKLIKTVSPSLSRRSPRHDQDGIAVTTIEDKKQRIIEKQHSDVSFSNNENEEDFNEEDLIAVPEVDNFIKQLIEG